MTPIRILIVDDAVVVRKALTDGLSQDPDLEVVGSASNGRLALAKLGNLQVDIILLDIEMPEMSGLEAIPEIRKILPKVPIIMFSALSERGAEATLEALSLGATDYVTKPSNMNMGSTSQSITQELIPKIRALCRLPSASHPHSAAGSTSTVKQPAVIRTRPAPFGSARISIVTIGVSTGGPDALGLLLPGIPAKFPLPIVVAQHMPPVFTAMLAKRLSERCALPVRECVSGDLLEPGCIWIAPGDYHMTVQKEDNHMVLRTNREPRENFCRPAVDVLFRSVAALYGANSLGVILTGMGQDGLKGCEALCAVGASIIIQDEASSIVWGMPGFVARAGLAEKILPLNQIASEIVRRVSASLPSLQLTH